MPQSADKKPETYVGPDGKTKVRMVPVDREVVKSENSQLAKLKLINKIKRSGVVKTGSMSKNEAKVEEKTLTPAEVRKRDKIAKAIKKDDPNMPMDKKMAIATATAKRVAEESEQLDELTAAELKLINQMYDKKGNLTPMGKKVMAHGKAKVNEVSSKTLSNYMRKSTASAGEPGASTRTQDKRIGGQKMADDKLRKMDGKGSAAKVAATNEESVNEISMGKLNKYAAKSSQDIDKNRNTVKLALDQPASPKHAKAGVDAMKKLHKRSRGSDMYVDKVTGRSKVKPTLETIKKMVKK